MIVTKYAPGEDLTKCFKDGDYKVRCFIPGHKDDSPSLSISKNDFMYHCFGQCSSDKNKGDFIKLVQVMENCSFIDALKILCNMGDLVFDAYDTKKQKEPEPEPQTPEIPLSVINKFHNNLINNKELLDRFNKKRGLPLEIIKRFKIGADDHGNFTVPIIEDNRYVSIKYRRGEDDSKKAKYWSHKSIGPDGEVIKYGRARLFNADDAKRAPSGTICVICAGEFDAIRLSEFSDSGIVAVSGTAGEGDWNDEWGKWLSHLKCIICYDNDKAGVNGANLVMKSIRGAKTIFLGDLEPGSDKIDITEFFIRGNTFDDFMKIVKEKIEVPAPQDRKESPEEIQKQNELLESLSPDDIKSMNPAFFIDENGIVYITAMFERSKTKSEKVKKKKKNGDDNQDPEEDSPEFIEIPYISNEPLIITSKKQIHEIPRVDKKILSEDPYAVAKFGEYTLKQEPARAQTRWCGKYVIDWIKGERELYTDAKQCFLDIYNTIKEYAKLSRKTYRGLIALYIMGSYFYEGFPSYPYLHLHGEKGSGKSTLGKLIAALAFNGEHVINPSLAALARGTEECKGLVVIDEAEKQSQREQGRSEIGQILNAGYQRGGKRVLCDTDNGNKRVSFDIYCPKVLCNIFGLNDTTKNRCITVKMHKIEAANLNKKDPEKSEEIHEISRHMYDILLGKAQSVLTSFDEVNKSPEFKYIETNKTQQPLKVYGRDRELFLPLLSMANFIYRESGYAAPWDNLLNELNEIAKEKLDDEDETPESVLRNYIVRTLEQEKVNEREFNMYDLVMGYRNEYLEDVHDVEKWISSTVKKCGWCVNYDRRRRVRKIVQVKMKNG
ncbi:MAG: hypothetical protein EHM64_00095, partial [Ignavibacteriae bacterium]